ncbi:MAG: GTPase Era [Francisellaceae bacterium]|jgi:GTPase|nr:GTPase Era [Francisellaceae bacterium]MBT6207833.1 GTPase Era [Francisellaceae bacterium]MBT6539041.1 GTPase Era [Francisellaceae bacterium]
MTTKCGFIAIVGRPNVGKSTLINNIIGQKISITTRKPQTTRNNILGVKTVGDEQLVFVDTPGMHVNEPRNLNRTMNKTAASALRDVDAVAFVVECNRWNDDDELVLEKVKKKNCPIILLLNKVDKIANKGDVLTFISLMQEKLNFHSIIPISAVKGTQVDRFLTLLSEIIPESPHYFEKEQITDKNLSFQIQELIREKLFICLGDELPYSLTVIVEKIEDTEKLLRVNALIMIERAGQKKIVVGAKGENLKKVGTQSRMELENILGKKVYIGLWVKVKDNWADNDKLLKQFGISDI